MELKLKRTIVDPAFQDTFNRTAYGIEISKDSYPFGCEGLLIAPLMELK